MRQAFFSKLAIVLACLAVPTGNAARADVLYASNGNVIATISPTGVVSPIATLPVDLSTGGQIYGLVVDGSGNLFATTYSTKIGGSSIYKVTPDGTVSQFATGFNTLEALAIDKSGNLYAAQGPYGIINKITPAGAVSVFAQGLGELPALAFDKSGNLYATTSVGGVIDVISPAGAVSQFVNTGEVLLSGLAIDANGNLFCSNNGPSIDKVTPNKSVSLFYNNFSGGDHFSAEIFDATGTLYVAEGFQINKFTPAGARSVLTLSSHFGPEAFAYQATAVAPEPTFLMLLVPAGLLVLANRSRRPAVK